MAKYRGKFVEPRCDQNRFDCFACSESRKCSILTDTHFERKCPFHKTVVEWFTERKLK